MYLTAGPKSKLELSWSPPGDLVPGCVLVASRPELSIRARTTVSPKVGNCFLQSKDPGARPTTRQLQNPRERRSLQNCTVCVQEMVRPKLGFKKMPHKRPLLFGR